MFKKLILILILGNLMNTSCNQSAENEINSSDLLSNNSATEKVFNEKFLDFLRTYIREVDGNFYDKNWLYYNVFFFERESEIYFTIWVFTAYPHPHVLREQVVNSCSQCLHEVNERKVLLIFNPEDELGNIFSVTEDCLLKAKLESEKEYVGWIYDGDMYARTYKISENESGIEFIIQEKVETPFKF